MHVVIGLLGLVAVLAATVATEGSHAFTGFLHRPALLLLVLAPPFVALISYRPEELWETARAVLRAIRRSPSRARAALYDGVSPFAADPRRGRPAEALSIAQSSNHPLFRQLAPLVVRQYAAGEIERTAGAAAYCLSSSLKRSEDVLTSLARVAPAHSLTCAEDARLLTRALALLAEGKPVADVRNLFQAPAGQVDLRIEA